MAPSRLHTATLHGAGELAGMADVLGEIALKAAGVVMQAYEAHVPIRLKSDASPVCEADEKSEALVLDALARRFPGIPVVAEEAVSRGEIPPIGRELFLVDPLDGTREFVARNGEFTINIGYVRDGRPVCGAVCAPVAGRLWLACGDHATVCSATPGGPLPVARHRTRLRARRADPQALTACISRSNLDQETRQYLSRLPVSHSLPMGSSIKFCRIAAGEGDVYPRFGTTMEWDTAAGDAVLRAAGGTVLDAAGNELRYGKLDQDYRNPAFVAWGDPEVARRLTG